MFFFLTFKASVSASAPVPWCSETTRRKRTLYRAIPAIWSKRKSMQTQPEKFSLQLIPPFSSFSKGKPVPIPFVIDGLLPQGGFSVLGAKPKQGKSSLSRFEAVCVSQGKPFLGRDTVQGEVILISLEDQRQHVDNCLHALGYDLQSTPRSTLSNTCLLTSTKPCRR
jgi:hypothetical protein